MFDVRARRLAPAIAVSVLGVPATAQPSVITKTITFEAAADAFVSGHPARAHQNFGAAGALSFAPAAAPGGEFESLLRFDLSGVPALLVQLHPQDWSIISATLELGAVPPSNPIFNAPAEGVWTVDWIVSDAWDEGAGTPSAPSTQGVTFNALPSFLSPDDEPLGEFWFTGASGVFSGQLVRPLRFETDIRDFGVVSLRVRSQGGSVVFNSREFAPAPGPQLVLVVRGMCRADMGCPVPWQPNCFGTVNNDDFFIFLAQFAAGNLAMTDMTGSAVPGQPGYGVPNGVLNNDDFFFYLTLFALGCNP